MEGKTKITLEYNLSDEWIGAQFIATGIRPDNIQKVELDLTQGTPEERSAILRLVRQNPVGGWNFTWRYSGYPEYDGEPTIAQVAADCTRLADKKENDWRKDLDEKAARGVSNFREHIEHKNPDMPSYVMLEKSELERAAALGMDISDYENALADYKAQRPEFVRLAEAARESREQYEAAIVEQKRLVAEKAAAEKSAWVDAHGSDHLRRACAAGHNCQRLYVQERAALEAPGFTVDFDDNAGWKDRSCPTTEALDALDTANALDIGEAEIVWLTALPHDKNDEEYWGEIEEGEAIVIRQYQGKYDLVKAL